MCIRDRCKDTNNKMLFGGTRAVVPSARGDLISADYYGPLPVSYTHLDVYKRQHTHPARTRPLYMS